MEIIADMLKTAKDGAKKTRIMYGANLSYELLEVYLPKLVEEGLLKRRDENGVYHLSAKGRGFLKRFAEFRKLQSIYGEKLVNLRKILLKYRNLQPNPIEIARGRPGIAIKDVHKAMKDDAI